ncbi:MAG TPA: 6-bladed beta-propeller [Blastocatellia bacterium]|nr:6-bladed beta-propeller [Blastocatellia bacterium]
MSSNKPKLTKLVAATLFGVALVFSLFIASNGEHGDKEKELYWPSPPDPPRIKYVRSIASPRDLKLKQSSFLKRVVKKIIGTEDPEPAMMSPYGIVTDSRQRIIAVDSKARMIHVFDPQEKKYVAIRAPKKEMFVSLVGVAVDGQDNIYVSDSYTGKIFIFDRNGKLIKRIGSEEGSFNRPTGIAIDKASRRLYVVETVKGEVDVLDLDGIGLFKFGKRGEGQGEFNHPTQICVSGDSVYVTDTLNARIQVFDKDGHFISVVGRHGDGIGDLDKPKGVAIDSHGHIYVVEGLRDRVQIFDKEGNLLLVFGETGSDRGEFYLPTAIHIDADDNIYISDSSNRRIQVFRYLRTPGAAIRD